MSREIELLVKLAERRVETARESVADAVSKTSEAAQKLNELNKGANAESEQFKLDRARLRKEILSGGKKPFEIHLYQSEHEHIFRRINKLKTSIREARRAFEKGKRAVAKERRELALCIRTLEKRRSLLERLKKDDEIAQELAEELAMEDLSTRAVEQL